jgi:hypothetical protein
VCVLSRAGVQTFSNVVNILLAALEGAGQYLDSIPVRPRELVQATNSHRARSILATAPGSRSGESLSWPSHPFMHTVLV